MCPAGGLPSSLASSSQLIYLNASFNNVSGTLVLFAFKLRSTPNSLQVRVTGDVSTHAPAECLPAYLRTAIPASLLASTLS